MVTKIIKVCSSCNNKSTGKKDIQVNHGFRMMRGKSVPQALCKNCRNLHKKKVRELVKKNPKLGKIDLRTIGKDKKWRSLMTTRSLQNKDIPAPLDPKLSKKIDKEDLKKDGNVKKNIWLKLSIKERQEFINSKRENKSLWDKLSKVEQKNYTKAHEKYCLDVDKFENSLIPITRRKYLKKRKALSNFKKDLITFQKSTMEKVSGVKV